MLSVKVVQVPKSYIDSDPTFLMLALLFDEESIRKVRKAKRREQLYRVEWLGIPPKTGSYLTGPISKKEAEIVCELFNKFNPNASRKIFALMHNFFLRTQREEQINKEGIIEQ